MKWKKTKKISSIKDIHFNTEDPAPAFEYDNKSILEAARTTTSSTSMNIDKEETSNVTTEELEKILLDDNKKIFLRYRAMFSLRNRGDKQSINALCKGFKSSSALMRHEIAYVLGQMENPVAFKGNNLIRISPSY